MAVCLSVFPHNFTKIDSLRITKLDIHMFHDGSWKLIYFGVRRLKVKVTSQLAWVFPLLWVLASNWMSHLPACIICIVIEVAINRNILCPVARRCTDSEHMEHCAGWLWAVCSIVCLLNTCGCILSSDDMFYAHPEWLMDCEWCIQIPLPSFVCSQIVSGMQC